MNSEVANKWVEALRSGQYEQGFGLLNDNNQYCVFGVLCDVHAKETGGHWLTSVSPEGKLSTTYKDKFGTLPEEVKKWAGITNIGLENKLIGLNDDKRVPFDDLAHIIHFRASQF